MAKMTLYELGEQERRLEDMLYESGGEMTPEIEALLSDNKEDMSAKVEGYNRIIREYDNFMAGCDEEIKRMTAKKKQAENAKTRIKEHILTMMRLFDWNRLKGAEGGVSITRSVRRSLDINEDVFLSPYDIQARVAEMKLPSYVTLVPKIDKAALARVLSEQAEMPDGAEFVEKEYITLR